MFAKRSFFCWLCLELCFVALIPVNGAESLSWIRTDNSVALTDGGTIIWQFNAGSEDSKPAFHPLSLKDGRILTGYRPDDHAWHRANWFSWKFLNGKNFWEEDEKGQGREGITEVVQWQFQAYEDFSAELSLAIRYLTLEENELLREHRHIIISPRGDGDYTITTTSRFKAVAETRINKWHYGGYAVRLSPELKDWKFIDDHGKVWDGRLGTMVRKDGNIIIASPASEWMAYVQDPSATTDGIAILDHPDNPGHPVHWLALPHMPYFNPVFFYENDLALSAGEELLLKYRLIVFHKKQAVSFLTQQQDRFITEHPVISAK